MPKEMNSPTNTPSTVMKALSLLSILKTEKSGIGIRELSEKMNLNRSTAYRLISALVLSGFARQDRVTKKFFLGMKLIELAGSMLSDMEIRKIARPFLKRLTEKTGEATHLGILDDDEVVYIEKIDGQEAVRLFTNVGSRYPAYVTSIGKAILAYLPEKKLDEVLMRQSWEPFTKNTITNKKEFIENLKAIRSRGYAIDNEENRLTVTCAGVAIFDSNNEVVAGISISGPSFRLTPQKIKKHSKYIIRTAADISRALGCSRSV